MSVLGNSQLLMTPEGYQISRSVRLRSSASASLNRTFGTPTNNKIWTWSGWIKRGKLGVAQAIIGTTDNNAASGNFGVIRFNASDSLEYFEYSSAYTIQVSSNGVYRDPSAWYHVVIAIDTTQATAANRTKFYVNGTSVSMSLSTSPSQNYNTYINSAIATYQGAYNNASSGIQNLFDGYLTEVNFIDGQALTPSSFGENDAITGVWKPKKYLGTYGTNGFYLPFSNPTITQLSDTATVTAPFGGTAANARAADGVYVTSNTTTGSTFTFVQYDFGSSTYLSRYSISNLYFTGGTSTFQVQYGDDSSWNTYTVAGTLSVTGSAQNFSGNINGKGRYLRLCPTSFGVNGQANVDALIIYSDNIGADASGNGNSWFPNNISVTSGVTYDSMLDTPTPYADGGNGRGNYAVLNPLSNDSTNTLSAANLNYSIAANASGYPTSTFQFDSGKWYWECTVTSTHNIIGIVIGTTGTTTQLFTTGYGYYAVNGNKYVNGTSSAYGASFTTNDVIGVAVDLTNLTIEFFKNGTSQGSISITAGLYKTAGGNGNSAAVASGVYNFGQRPFAYTPPTGFKALNTQNLPEGSIKKGSAYFDVALWTGNNTARSITTNGDGNSLQFNPDFIWGKSRGSASGHLLYDAVRGVDKSLATNNTAAEDTTAGQLTAFSASPYGFQLPTDTAGYLNYNSRTYVGWLWKKGATPGFDIVTYTGDGTSARAISHSLGVAPKMVIVKLRSGAGENWNCWHTSLGNTAYRILLNTTGAVDTGSPTIWGTGGINPTSTTFQVGSSTGTNGNTSTYVAYLFAEVAGFSKFGSYTGNGSTDGPFIYLGFKARFILMKRTDSSPYSWYIYDTARNTYNALGSELLPNDSAAEAANSADMDITASGWKIRTSGVGRNASGGTYIFAAFAENPFKYSLAR